MRIFFSEIQLKLSSHIKLKLVHVCCITMGCNVLYRFVYVVSLVFIKCNFSLL